MSKKKLSNKERDNAIAGLSQNDQVLWKEILDIKQIFSLYLEYRQQTEKFDKFVKGKVEEFEKKQRSNIKE